MRKAQKRQIEEFLRVLDEAHKEIKRQIENHSSHEAMIVLEQCQQGAVQLGELIESIEGEECVTIRLLENYCEIVYQLYQDVGQNQMNQIHKIYKNLCRHLVKIENSVRNDIKIRKEIVFLPYKASMWDSLESVWQAADADPDCDAYVIPIPYYDRGADGSFLEMHYEGDLYPEYVPVVGYENYDFEKRKPDMIFIHNPYDEYNYVTSVAPFFYSKNLKKYTEQLIYIPYFLLGEINNPNDPNVLDGIAQYCITQGVMNADKVVVQSENMRQAYINVLTRQAGEETRGYWEGKILGLGSPKIDKVLNTRKEDLEIPKEWMKILRKADGQFKKVILYNTGVTALLKYEEKLLRKIRDVMKVFKENKDDVVLLWRPHPLMLTTLKSMRPQLLGEYEEIVEEYREEGWGIYDDTADMDRAVCLSDAYYGDWSSIVWLYQAVGKAVMIQNMNILSKKKVTLSCADVVDYDDGLFILTRDTQSLFKYDIKTQGMKLCGRVGDKLGQLFVSMTLCENKLYIAPYEAEGFAIYDIEKEKFEFISLLQQSGEMYRKRYHLSFSYHRKVFFLGGVNSVMLCIDVETNAIKEMPEWSYEFENKYGYKASVRTHTEVCIMDDCFWVALDGDNLILQYNILNDEYRFWEIGNKKMQYVTVNYDGEFFWFSGDKEIIVRWDKKSNEVKVFDRFPINFICGSKECDWKELFSRGYLLGNKIYFTPLNSNMLVRLDKISGKLDCVLTVEPDHICFQIVRLSDDELYIEIDNIDTLLVENAYIIEKSGKCRVNPIIFKKKDDISAIEQNISTNLIENHPQYISSALSALGKEKYSFLNKNYVGEHIFHEIQKINIEKV